MFRIFNKNKSAKEYPDYWKSYISLFSGEFDKSADIDGIEFSVFDIETSGLNLKRDQILSIGAVRVFQNEIDTANILELYLKHENYNTESVHIHGILGSGRENKIDEAKAIERFVNYIGNSVLVGHNVEFDISMINRSLKKLTGGKLKNKVLDTRKLYQRLTNAFNIPSKSLSLDSICDEFSISKSDRHMAAGDALITAILLVKLVNRLKKRGVNQIGELLRNTSTLF